MKHIFYVVLILLTGYSSQAFSSSNFCTEQKVGTVVVFGNGIMDTDKDMSQSLIRIVLLLNSKLSSEEFSKLKFNLARNKSYGLLKDLYESAKQKLGSDNTIISFWRWVGNQKTMPKVLRESARRLVIKFDFSTQVASKDLANQIALYRTSILEGNKVLVVSHSQGNFFVNAAYLKLFKGEGAISNTGSFGVVAVATPASFVAGNGPYTTLVEDTVIGAISIATPVEIIPPLPPNITNILSGAQESNFWGHSFLGEYMATGSNTVKKITDDIVGMLNSLVPPIKEVRSGIITSTLTWGPKADVDLHVFEPNSTHVYYQNRAGISGYLDLDDTNGDGPEHYYVSCNTLEPGTYKIGVNYYIGLTFPEIALVQIKAGLSIRNFIVKINSVAGNAGNNSPIPVADIVVTGSAKKGYNFSIKNRIPSANKGDVKFSIGEF